MIQYQYDRNDSSFCEVNKAALSGIPKLDENRFELNRSAIYEAAD